MTFVLHPVVNVVISRPVLLVPVYLNKKKYENSITVTKMHKKMLRKFNIKTLESLKNYLLLVPST